MRDQRLYQGPIYVKRSPIHGYGVFAEQDLATGQIIEECLALPYPHEVKILANYCFDWRKCKAILLGYACIYNHSDTPNILYEDDLDRDLVIFKTKRNIRKGEELFISYGPRWFSSRRAKAKSNYWWRKVYHQGGGLVLRAILVILGVYACVYGVPYLSF